MSAPAGESTTSKTVVAATAPHIEQKLHAASVVTVEYLFPKWALSFDKPNCVPQNHQQNSKGIANE